MDINTVVFGWTLSVLAITLPAVSDADITVGTATAHVGERVNGFIQVPGGVDAPANISLIIIHGAKDGPRLALIAGSYGTKYASIIGPYCRAGTSSSYPGSLVRNCGCVTLLPVVLAEDVTHVLIVLVTNVLHDFGILH
jgi:hypothetical protein